MKDLNDKNKLSINMQIKIFFLRFYIQFVIILYSFFINWFSANIGVMPIDTFGFFDTGYSILIGKLPMRDFWSFSGIVVDYFQSIFFWLFGLNWSSYIFHASSINVLATLSFYYFLKIYNLNNKLILILCISFATLCYPVSGTPYHYLHSYIFSLISILFFLIAVKKENNLFWFVLPFIFFLSFFSMQTPSVYIIILLTTSSLFYFFYKKKIKNFKYFCLGIFFSFLLFITFLLLSNTGFTNLLYEYFLFPITIGKGRLLSDSTAYVKLFDQLNFKRIFGDFKFINIYYFILLFITLKNLKKKNNELFLLNFTILTSTFLFFFNQLNQANQIYIFSLLPILASTIIINLSTINNTSKKNIIYFMIVILLFSTLKYHFRYNVDRKFLDIENLNKNLAVDGKLIDAKFENLKWISPNFKNPKDEIDLINTAIKILKSDGRKKSIVTNYQLFSVILEQDLNIINKWYLWDNNTHPTENHKYYWFYKKFINENINRNKVEVIYILGAQNKIALKSIKNYFDNKCFKDYIIVENKFSYHEIVNCKNK